MQATDVPQVRVTCVSCTFTYVSLTSTRATHTASASHCLNPIVTCSACHARYKNCAWSVRCSCWHRASTVTMSRKTHTLLPSKYALYTYTARCENWSQQYIKVERTVHCIAWLQYATKEGNKKRQKRHWPMGKGGWKSSIQRGMPASLDMRVNI